MEHDFEMGMLEELQHLDKLIQERRAAILDAKDWSQQSIGALFALGAVQLDLASATTRLRKGSRDA